MRETPAQSRFLVLIISRPFPFHRTLSRDGRAMETDTGDTIARRFHRMDDGTVTGAVVALMGWPSDGARCDLPADLFPRRRWCRPVVELLHVGLVRDTEAIGYV